MNNDMQVFSFWAIDDLKDERTLKKQLSEMKSMGFDGVVFHPRRYCNVPLYLSDEYMSAVTDIILYSKSIEMEFWLYDENGWPSGSADGQVLKSIPDLKCKWLEYENGNIKICERTGINSLDPRGVAKFIELTHEAYKTKLAPEAFDWVSGFFSDEVGFLEGHGACMDRSGIPWFDGIEELYDGDIYTELPKLFLPEPDQFKSWYWETLTKRLRETFYGMIESWCKDNGKLFTAHLKGEEDPFFQIGYSGSCFGALSSISVPGIDALERYAGNAYYLNIASSISRQFGSGIAMAEAMGGAGWGLTPAHFEKYNDKLIDCGTNMIVLHINQLHLSYDGITDWPASIPCHEPWRDAFTQLILRMKKRAASVKEPEILLIAPVRGTMERFAPSLVNGMNEHDGSYQMLSDASVISRGAVEAGERLYNAGISFDVTDEKTFDDNAVFEDGIIRLGNAVYKKAVTVKGCVFDQAAPFKGEMSRSDKGGIIHPYEELFSEGMTQTPWTITPPQNNIYPIEITDGSGVIDAEYICDCVLTVSDPCEVRLNGERLISSGFDEYGYHYPVSGLRLGINTIELSVYKAFAYLTGKFRILNREPFFEFDARQIRTKYAFYIAAPDSCSNDLILSGYPFAFESVTAEKTLGGDICGDIRIDCSHIAAAHVYIDGVDCGWIYEGNDTVNIPVSGKNTARLVCKIYQTAYNLYGPIHHLEGDRHLTSPAQYEGEKNFADTPSLPKFTLENDIKLLKWRINAYISAVV